MDTLLRSVILFGGLVAMVVLFYLNVYAAERYWLPTVEENDDGESTE